MQLASWEATQQVRINLWQFILGNGPVVVLAIFGLPFFIQKITTARLIALLFTFLTLGLYFSPIPQQLSIVNVRFLPATTTLFFACFASQTVYQLALRFKRKQGLTAVIITGLIICILVSTYFVQIQNKIKTDTTNGFYYIAKKAYDAQNFTRSISSADDTFLVIWPFNWSFPAITGRRVFEGHSLLTIDYEKKAKQASDFFFGQTEEKQMQELLDREKIDYIVAYPWTRNMDKLSKVKKIYDNGYMAVYRVEPK